MQLKEIDTQAHFLDPIHHEDQLNHFTGIRTNWYVEGILFDNAECKYDECEEADGSFVMHSLEFADGSECYFEILEDGTLSHFMSSGFVELRHGLLVVSPRSAFESSRSKREGHLKEQTRRHGRNIRKIRFDHLG